MSDAKSEAWQFFLKEEDDRLNRQMSLRDVGIFRDIAHSLFDPTVTDAEFRERVKICLIVHRIILPMPKEDAP